MAFEQCGFVTGAANPCLFFHPEKNIEVVVVHGDDVTALGTDEAIDWHTEQLKASFEIKVRGRLGLECDQTEINNLNRVIRVKSELGLLYEADPPHVEILSESTGLVGCSSVKTPGVKPVDASAEAPKGEEGELVVINSSGVVYKASGVVYKAENGQIQ